MPISARRAKVLFSAICTAFAVLATIVIASPATANGHLEGHKYVCSSQHGRYLDADGKYGNSGRYNVSTSATPNNDDIWEIREIQAAGGSGNPALYVLRNKQKRTYLDSDGADKDYNVDGSLTISDDDKWEIRENGDEVALFNVDRQRFLSAEYGGRDNWNVNTVEIPGDTTRWQILDTDEECQRTATGPSAPAPTATPRPTVAPAPTPRPTATPVPPTPVPTATPVPPTPVPTPTPGSPAATPTPIPPAATPTPGSPAATPTPIPPAATPTPPASSSVSVQWRNIDINSGSGVATATMRVTASGAALSNETFRISSDSAGADRFDLVESDAAISCTELAGADAGIWECTGLTVAANTQANIVFTMTSLISSPQSVTAIVPGATSNPSVGIPAMP